MLPLLTNRAQVPTCTGWNKEERGVQLEKVMKAFEKQASRNGEITPRAEPGGPAGASASGRFKTTGAELLRCPGEVSKPTQGGSPPGGERPKAVRFPCFGCLKALGILGAVNLANKQ